MSQWNTTAQSPESIEATRKWLRRTSPLVFLHGLSGVGKTHLIGSLFRHQLYANAADEANRVLYIDGDSGSTTIAEYSYNTKLCKLNSFNDQPENLGSWFHRQLMAARREKCGAIVVEGLVRMKRTLLAQETAMLDRPEKMAARQAHVVPSSRTGEVLASLDALKMSRTAAGQGVPIIVTINSHLVPQDPKDPNSPTMVVPDMSPNLTDKMKSAADALIELSRSSSGTRLITMPDASNMARKMRACVPSLPQKPGEKPLPNAATLAQQQINLELPGLFALWADCDRQMTEKLDALLEGINAPKTEETQ